MSRIDVEAIVLRVVAFGESDLVAHLLTPATSRLTVIAKGARRSRKRFPGSLDLFNHLEVQIERRRPHALARLEQARLLDPFPALRASSSRFALACYAVELLGRLAPEGTGGREGRRLFGAALGALRVIATGAPEARLRVLLELRLLGALGLAPELRRCVRCAREIEGPEIADFHVAEGGPVCTRCAAPGDTFLPVHLGTLRALEQALRLPLDRLERLALGVQAQREAEELLGPFQRFHTGVELRSARFLAHAIAAEKASSPA